MLNKFIHFILLENTLFAITRKFYCSKNNGNCDNCKCWSCYTPLYRKRGNKNG